MLGGNEGKRLLTCKNLWMRFEASGKVEDYLNYLQAERGGKSDFGEVTAYTSKKR